MYTAKYKASLAFSWKYTKKIYAGKKNMQFVFYKLPNSFPSFLSSFERVVLTFSLSMPITIVYTA